MRKLIMCVSLALMSAVCTYAQGERSAEDRAQMRSEMVQRQAERLAKEFDLKGDTKTAFMNTFVAYQTEMIEDMQSAPQAREEENADTKKKELTDAEAKAKIEETFARQERQIAMMTRRMAIQKKYYEELSKILTPQQLVKIFAQQRSQQRNNQGQQQGQRMRGQGGFGGPGGPRGGFGGPGGGFGGGF